MDENQLPEGWWVGPALTFGCSGFIVGVLIVGLAWWLS